MEVTAILGLCRGYIGIMGNKMKASITLGLYRGYVGIVENKMEVAVIPVKLGLHRRYIGIMGRAHRKGAGTRDALAPVHAVEPISTHDL